MSEGVLIERHVTEDDKMPTLFSLLHPLDDIAPLITRIGKSGKYVRWARTIIMFRSTL